MPLLVLGRRHKARRHGAVSWPWLTPRAGPVVKPADFYGHLFRRYVAAAANGSLVRLPLRRRQAEITELEGATIGEQGALRLDASVVDAFGMHVLDGISLRTCSVSKGS